MCEVFKKKNDNMLSDNTMLSDTGNMLQHVTDTGI
jgi:hypothetical protein